MFSRKCNVVQVSFPSLVAIHQGNYLYSFTIFSFLLLCMLLEIIVVLVNIYWIFLVLKWLLNFYQLTSSMFNNNCMFVCIPLSLHTENGYEPYVCLFLKFQLKTIIFLHQSSLRKRCLMLFIEWNIKTPPTWWFSSGNLLIFFVK
jgi:hypothetical protein